MTDLAILLSLVCIGAWVAQHLLRRGVKGVREKIVTDRKGNQATGKDAVTVARMYLFFGALSLILAIVYLILLVRLLWRDFAK
jgi:hypothetical protein